MSEETATAPVDQATEAVQPAVHGDTEAARSTTSGEPEKVAGQTAEATDAATDDAGVDDGDELAAAFTQDEIAAIKADPKLRKVYKSVTKAFTQKTQALSEQRRFYEYFEKNPAQALKWFAEHHGFGLVEPPRQEDVITQTLSQAVGPDQAKVLAPLMQDITKAIVAQEVEPIRRTQQQQMAESAYAQAESAMKAFEAEHPDWKDLEDDMMAVAKKVVPSSQITETEWLGMLYNLASSKRDISKQAKAAVSRMTKSAAAAAEATAPVSGSRVALSSAKVSNVREAFELAKRGQRVED